MTAKVEEKENKGIPVDEAFLQKYLERGGSVTDIESGQELSKDDVDALLEQDVDEHKKQTDAELNTALTRGEKAAIREKKEAEQKQLAEKRRQQRLQERTEKLNAADEARLQREAAKEQEQARLKAEREGKVRQEGIRETVSNVGSNLSENVQPWIDRVGSMKTVGGIGLLVAILLFLQLALVQVNDVGDTRLKQFWYMLNGRATLQGRVNPMTGSQGTTTSIDTTGGVPIKPDGSCPPGFHGAMANGKLFCQPDNKSITTTPTTSNGFSNNSSYRSFTGL